MLGDKMTADRRYKHKQRLGRRLGDKTTADRDNKAGCRRSRARALARLVCNMYVCMCMCMWHVRVVKELIYMLSAFTILL